MPVCVYIREEEGGGREGRVYVCVCNVCVCVCASVYVCVGNACNVCARV